jgi:hypothetical protein
MNGVLYFALCFGVGSVATYFLVMQKFEKQAQEDINEMREEYKKTITDAITDAVDNLNEVSEKKQEASLFREYDPHATEYHKITARKDAAVIIEPRETEVETEAEKESPREEVAELPYIITPDDFANTMRFHDKITISCYDDGVLMNEEGDPVDMDLIGIENVKRFVTGKTEDNDWMYIRNERISTDFEVERIHCNYSDVDAPDDGS